MPPVAPKIRGRLRKLWSSKIAGVPAPIVIGGAVVAAFIIMRARRREAEGETFDEDEAADLSGGFGAAGPISTGVGGVGNGGGVIGLPGTNEDPFEQSIFFDNLIPIPGRGGRGIRPRGGSRERVNRAALREARRRAVERFRREQKERRLAVRRRIERQRKERRELKQRLLSRQRAFGRRPPRIFPPRRRPSATTIAETRGFIIGGEGRPIAPSAQIRGRKRRERRFASLR